MWRGSPGSLQTIPNMVSCLRCKMAVPGSDPVIKWTNENGDLTESLVILCRVLLYCWSIHDISFSERTKLARPDISTGVPYKDKILSPAVGLDQLPFAKPQETIEPKAFLNEATLSRILGRLPQVDRRTPTCSAWSTNLICSPSILIGL